jgi:hypothetical protein
MSFSEIDKVSNLQNLYSINPIAKSEKFKNILLKNPNVCIYPLQIETAIQMYESDTDFKELNKALTISDYQVVKPYLPTFPFQNFLKQFETSFYSVKEYCDLKNFIVFPLHIEFYDNYKGKITFAGHHASLAIFQQDKDTIYIIDSDNIQNKDKDIKYNEKDYEKYLCKKVKYCIEKIMDKKCKIKFLDLRTPQSITKDNYCIFWSMALTNELFIEEKFNPEKTMNKFINKYKTKKDLGDYIRNFISNL